MQIKDSTLEIDYITDLSGEGVTVEDVIFNEGSITIPGDFLTCCGVEFLSALYSNGGIFADAGTGSNQFSFTIEDNTGDVYVLSDVRAQGGINASDRFFVDGISGDTRIEEALLRPNGGIFIDDTLAFSSLGDIATKGSLQAANDLFFGEFSATSKREISRLFTLEANGGTTYMVGQDAAEVGGDLLLAPGDGADIGDIFLGSSRNSDLFFGRTALASNDAAGQFAIIGQTSFSGNGGDLIFNGGDSGTIGNGGDIIIKPGFSALDGTPGKMIVGSPKLEEADHDLLMGRPTVASGPAGVTTYRGQNTADGVGGNVYIQAGDTNLGTGEPGDVILTAGVAGGVQSIQLGKNTATHLNVRRVPTVTSGGATLFQGQNSTGGAGGDLHFRAGSAAASAEGGVLFLRTGSSITGKSGDIVLGSATDAITISRPQTSNIALIGDTTISGQEGINGVGGDLYLVGGDGLSQGGDVLVIGGESSFAQGGTVAISGGAGVEQGGEIIITAGHGGQRHGGEVSIAGEQTILSTIGTVSNGNIIAGPAAARFYVDEVQVEIIDEDIVIYGGNDFVTISPNPDAVISWNGVPVLKETQGVAALTSVTAPTLATIRTDVSQLSADYNTIVQALNQCGHGLFISVTEPNTVPQNCP